MIRPPPNSTPTYTPFPDTNALPILGVSALVPAADGGWTPIAGEGGHVSFAPRNEREFALWRAAHAQFGHVSMECMLSGPGLRFIYQTLIRLAGATAQDWSAAPIRDRKSTRLNSSH